MLSTMCISPGPKSRRTQREKLATGFPHPLNTPLLLTWKKEPFSQSFSCLLTSGLGNKRIEENDENRDHPPHPTPPPRSLYIRNPFYSRTMELLLKIICLYQWSPWVLKVLWVHLKIQNKVDTDLIYVEWDVDRRLFLFVFMIAFVIWI